MSSARFEYFNSTKTTNCLASATRMTIESTSCPSRSRSSRRSLAWTLPAPDINKGEYLIHKLRDFTPPYHLSQAQVHSHAFALLHYYTGNRLLSGHLSQGKPTSYADLLNNWPKVYLEWHIGAIIYLLYKWFYFITGYFISGFYCSTKSAVIVSNCNLLSLWTQDAQLSKLSSSLTGARPSTSTARTDNATVIKDEKSDRLAKRKKSG